MLPALLSAVLLVCSATAVRAAAVSWNGGAGDWNVPGNWSGGTGVPTNSDDVTIAAGLVTVYSTDPLVAVQSLSLGGAGAILRTSTGVAVTGAFDLQPGSALQFAAPLGISAGSFIVQSGSSVTFYGPAVAAAPAPALFVQAGLFDLRAGSTVTLKGRGYAGAVGAVIGSGPGPGYAGSGTSGGGGAAHGGAGAAGGGAPNGGVPYDGMPPLYAGSGGGGTPSANGGSGGGFLQVSAATAALNGLLAADGEPGVTLGFQGGGGGSGGAIVVRAQVITGSGTASARGGDGGSGADYGGGGGGGGLVWIQEYSGYSVLHSTLTVHVEGGDYGGGFTDLGGIGSDGAVFVDPRHWGGGGADALASNRLNWSAGLAPRGGERLVFGSSATAKGCLWDMPSVAVGSATLTTMFSTTVVLASSLNVTGAFDMYGGTVVAGAGLVLRVGGDLTQTGGRIDLAVSTLSLAGAGGVMAAGFFDARAARLVVGGLAPATATVTGMLEVSSRAYLSSGALLFLSTGVVRFDGDGPFAGPGSVDAVPGSVALAAGSSSQTWTAWPGRIGALRVSNFAAGGLTLSTAAGSTFVFNGGVSADTGTVLQAAATYLRVGGGWSAYGTALLSNSTAAFGAVSGAAAVTAGAAFDNIVIDAGAGCSSPA